MKSKLRIAGFVFIAAVSTWTVARPGAAEFNYVTFRARLVAALAYCAIALLLSFLIGLADESISWRRITSIGCLISFVAAATYSCVRQEFVLIVFPALFAFSGGILGAEIASAYLSKLSASQKAFLPVNQVDSEPTVNYP